jgi:hypothetical protein
MACEICERPGYRRICLDCKLDNETRHGDVQDFRAPLTDTCDECGCDLSATEKRQKHCPYCGGKS